MRLTSLSAYQKEKCSTGVSKCRIIQALSPQENAMDAARVAAIPATFLRATIGNVIVFAAPLVAAKTNVTSRRTQPREYLICAASQSRTMTFRLNSVTGFLPLTDMFLAAFSNVMGGSLTGAQETSNVHTVLSRRRASQAD
jgi:hypothetical protein